MNLPNEFNLIAVEKPVRGREMRTTVIPQETIKAMKVVSTKTMQDEAWKLDSNKMGDCPEVYHEGYIDGKLYLVPDSNLQAMRDIVNRKMKRQQGANKPQYLVDNTSKYSEFATKFDTLIEKIDQFAESSSEELIKPSKRKAQKKLNNFKKQNPTHNDGEPINSLEKERDDDKNAVSEYKNRYNSEQLNDNKTDIDYHGDIIPPLLDDKIKYKRVKRNSFVSNEFEIDTEQDYKRNIPTPNQFLDDDTDNWNHPIEDPDSEIFRFLISGHFNSNSSPTFIIHQNYIGPNILESYIPDFKSHKKEGNVHIFISGKFFTHDILVDETISTPAALSIPPYIIPINKENSILQEQFKGVYDLGAVDIVLEGEFVKDDDTQQCTPIISLEILKHDPLASSSDVDDKPTTVLYTKNPQKNPFKVSDDINQTNKHVHYAAKEHTELKTDESSGVGIQISKWKSLKNVIKNIAVVNLLRKTKSNIDKHIESTEGMIANSQDNESFHSVIKIKKPIELKQRFRGKGGQQRRHTILEEIKEDKLSEFKIISAPASPQKSLSFDEKQFIKKDAQVKKKKIKKEDKNKAIVENPILAQMQEFFIA